MIHDGRKHIQQLGWRRVLNSRESKSSNLRDFHLNELNFNATEYYEMISWHDCETSEPSLIMDTARDEVLEYISSGNSTDIGIKFICRTQAVERNIKLVTETSSLVVGAKARHGFVLTTMKSRTKHPKLESKKDLKQ